MPYRSLMLRRAFGVAILALSLAPLPASAHAILESSTPPAGGSVPAGTVAMQFHYNSRIDRQRSRLVLTRPDHGQTTLKIAADDPPEVLSTTAELTPGSYSVRWQVLAIDGHITRGDVRFTVTGR
ncbi:MAG: copper resistance protein CopC [Acetobacteraceae bacterium]|nr:copper resistance protein CopC [Acetobacteraceae bacterium]